MHFFNFGVVCILFLHTINISYIKTTKIVFCAVHLVYGRK